MKLAYYATFRLFVFVTRNVAYAAVCRYDKTYCRMFRYDLSCTDFGGLVKRHFVLRPRSVNHSRPVALNIAERARNNITDTVNHPNLKACVIRKIYLYRIFGDELRLGRHYCSAGGGLR